MILCLLSGSVALLYEVVWLRLLTLSMGHNSRAVGILLAVVVGGLAVGAWAAGRAGSSMTPVRALRALHFVNASIRQSKRRRLVHRPLPWISLGVAGISRGGASWLVLVLGTIAVGAQDSFQLQREIPGVITEGTPLEVAVGGFQGLEGPVGALDGALYFSDIPANRTYKIDAKGMMSVWRENTNGANGLFMTKDGRLLAAEGNGRRIVAVAADGRVMAVATQFNGQPFRAPNDLIGDSKGGVYFTDPAPRPAPDVAPKEPGNVYYLTPNGDVLLLDAQIQRPNGVTLSLDEKTLYVGNTEGEFVYAFDVQPDGRVANKREFVKLREAEKGSLGLRSRADGMALDAAGRLYVATAAGIQVIDSRGGHVGIIRVPSVARNVAFGGPGRRTLYMTALESLYKVSTLSQGPPGRSK